jgi:hypothetical protein
VKLWDPIELSRTLDMGTTANIRTVSIAAVCGVDLADLPDRVRDALAQDTGDRSDDTFRVVAACYAAALTLEDARAAVGSRSDLAERLAERQDDDVQNCWLRAINGSQERRRVNAELMAMLPGPAASTPVTPQEAPTSTAAGGWTPVNLSDVVAGLINGSLHRPVPTIGVRTDGAALFYRGKVNGDSGASGSGKSWTVLLACAQAIAKGEDVVWIDFESDPAETVGRLLDLGADPAAIREHFHYIQPDMRLGEDGVAALAELVRATEATVAVIDSVGESMAMEGDSPNDDDDTARWFRRLPTMLAKLGPAVIIIDHVTKADDRDPGLWPIGSQRKRAAISGAQYMQRPGKPFSKGQPGTARIICAKDRAGTYRQGEHVATLTVTPGGPVLMELHAPAAATDAGTSDRTAFRPTYLMEKVSRALEAAPEPLSQNAVLDPAVVKGQEKAKTGALRLLVAEGFVSRSSGPRNSMLHESVRPYRQADDPLSDSYVGERETVTDSSTTATVAVSKERETGDGRSTAAGRRSGDGRATVAGQQLLAVGHPS